MQGKRMPPRPQDYRAAGSIPVPGWRDNRYLARLAMKFGWYRFGAIKNPASNGRSFKAFLPTIQPAEEDRKRARGLRATARLTVPAPSFDEYGSLSMEEMTRIPGITAMYDEGSREDSLDLAGRLESEGDRGYGFPSAIYHNAERWSLLHQVLLLTAIHDLPIQLVTLTHADWRFPTYNLVRSSSFFDRDPQRQLKSMLSRCGVTAAKGFLVAHHDIEFDPNGESIQLYYSGLVAGPKISALRQLTTGAGITVSSQSGPLAPASLPLARLATEIADFWPLQTWGQFGYRLHPDSAKSPETLPLQRLYLLWLEHKRLEKLLVVSGLGQRNAQLRLIGC